MSTKGALIDQIMQMLGLNDNTGYKTGVRVSKPYHSMSSKEIADAELVVIRAFITQAKECECCEQHRTRTRGSDDWKAVIRMLANLQSNTTEAADRIIEFSARRLAGDEVSLREELMYTRSSIRYQAMCTLNLAHLSLLENGCLNTDMTDMHYDRMLGICEELIREDHEKQARFEAGEVEGAGQRNTQRRSDGEET